MSIIDRFNSFAEAFEACVTDDKWERLGKYFSENAMYQNIGEPGPAIKGRTKIIEYLKNDISNNDRRFDSRNLQAISKPVAVGNKLSRNWRCTYTLAGATDLVIEGEARYEFDGELICFLKEEITPESLVRYVEWMEKFGSMLHA